MVFEVFILKIKRPISSSLKFTVVLVTLQQIFDKIDEKFSYTIYGLKWSSQFRKLKSVEKMNFQCLFKKLLIRNGRDVFLAWSVHSGRKGLTQHILSFAIFVFTSGIRRNGASPIVFSDNISKTEDRSSNWLKTICSVTENLNMLTQLGVDVLEVGTHSFRKGVAEFLSGMVSSSVKWIKWMIVVWVGEHNQLWAILLFMSLWKERERERSMEEQQLTKKMIIMIIK